MRMQLNRYVQFCSGTSAVNSLYSSDQPLLVLSQKKWIEGYAAFANQEYGNSSFAERKLIGLMERCWEFDPSKRLDIFEAVRDLRDAVQQNHQQSGQGNSSSSKQPPAMKA